MPALLKTGRLGASVPADHIIATIIALIGAYALPLSLSFVQRVGRPAQKQIILFLGIVTVHDSYVFPSGSL